MSGSEFLVYVICHLGNLDLLGDKVHRPTDKFESDVTFKSAVCAALCCNQPFGSECQCFVPVISEAVAIASILQQQPDCPCLCYLYLYSFYGLFDFSSLLFWLTVSVARYPARYQMFTADESEDLGLSLSSSPIQDLAMKREDVTRGVVPASCKGRHDVLNGLQICHLLQ